MTDDIQNSSEKKEICILSTISNLGLKNKELLEWVEQIRNKKD